MSYSSEQTRQRILECAKKEFLEQGYQKANLRKIAEDAKATTGALYNHFKNKEVLFEALVKEPADTLLQQFQQMHNRMEESIPTVKSEQLTQDSSKGTDWMLEYIYEYFDIFRLIFCCSEGHAYSHFLNQLSEIEEASYQKMIDSLNRSGKPVGDFFIHVMCASGFRELYEIVSHNLTKEEAVDFMEQVKRLISIRGLARNIGAISPIFLEY